MEVTAIYNRIKLKNDVKHPILFTFHILDVFLFISESSKDIFAFSDVTDFPNNEGRETDYFYQACNQLEVQQIAWTI